MDHYKVLAVTSSTLSVVVALILGNIANYFLIDNGLLLLVVLSLIILLSSIYTIIINFFINSVSAVRRIILGRQYLEGLWIDRVTRNDAVIGYGLITVSSDLENIRINGEWYDPAFKQKGETFQSYHLKIEWPLITFIHSAHRPDKAHTPTINGITVIDIQENIRGPPTQWTGYFTDTLENTYNNTIAYKITDKALIRKLTNSMTKKDAIKEFVGKTFEKPLAATAE